MNKMLNVSEQKKISTTPDSTVVNLIVDDESKTKITRPKLLCVEEVTYLIRGKQINKSVVNVNEKEEKEDEITSPSSTLFASSSSSSSFTCSISSSASSL